MHSSGLHQQAVERGKSNRDLPQQAATRDLYCTTGRSEHQSLTGFNKTAERSGGTLSSNQV